MDLGTDKIYIYEFNSDEGTLHSASTPEISVVPGAGPRHLALHRSGNFAYLVEELTSTVGVFSVDKTSGTLTILQDSVKSLPENFTKKIPAQIFTPTFQENILYMSNRGANVLSIYTIGEDGRITFIDHQSTGGKVPRNFLVDPKGQYLFARESGFRYHQHFQNQC